VDFHLFQPKPPIAGEVVTENPVQVEVVGGYHQVGSFLAEMANLDRLINVSGLALVPEQEPADERHTLHATFTATAYSFNGPGGGVPVESPDSSLPGETGQDSPEGEE
jgi:type IV pilus assembly protein PilO